MKQHPFQVADDLKEAMPYYPGKFETTVDELLKVRATLSLSFVCQCLVQNGYLSTFIASGHLPCHLFEPGSILNVHLFVLFVALEQF